MDDKLTVGYAFIPAQGINSQFNFKEFEQLIKIIGNIDKRLENIEKLLLELQQSQDKADKKNRHKLFMEKSEFFLFFKEYAKLRFEPGNTERENNI